MTGSRRLRRRSSVDDGAEQAVPGREQEVGGHGAQVLGKRFERTLLPETVSVTEIARGFTEDGGHDGRRRQASSQA